VRVTLQLLVSPVGLSRLFLLCRELSLSLRGWARGFWPLLVQRALPLATGAYTRCAASGSPASHLVYAGWWPADPGGSVHRCHISLLHNRIIRDCSVC